MGMIMRKRIYGLAVGVASSAMLYAVATGARAQQVTPPKSDESASVVQEVVVTAQKRQTNLQSTPMAVEAISAKDLAARQLTSAAALFEILPNVHFGESEGMAQLAIRGIGFDNVTVGGDPRVAYHVDGVYLSRPDAVLGTQFDVSRIEVLYGPQGTLYGRNSTAGTINVITNDPASIPSGYADVTVGSYSLTKFDGAVSGPLADGLSGRLAIESVDRDGYGENVNTGKPVDDEHERSARIKLKYAPQDGHFDFVLAADYLNENDSSAVYQLLGPGGLSAPNTPIQPSALQFGGSYAHYSNRYDVDTNSDPLLLREAWGLTGTAHAYFDGFTLTSITGYHNSQYHWVQDFDSTLAELGNLNIYERAQQESEELRLARNFGPVKFDIGGYFFHESLYGYSEVPINSETFGGPDAYTQGYWAGGGLDTLAGAVFFNAEYDFAPKWALAVGGRYSSEKKTADEFYELNFTEAYSPSNPIMPAETLNHSHVWSNFSPKVTLSYSPTSKVYVYATYDVGFKSGGFNLGGLQPAFAPETLTDYEGGVKADWLDGHLRTDVSGFYYDYSNLQVNKIVGNLIETVNAAKATLYGLEANASFIPADHFLFTVNGSLLHSRYDTFTTGDAARTYLGTINLAGNELDQAPPYKIDVTGQYTWGTSYGNVILEGDYTATGRVYYSAFEQAADSQAAYETINGFLKLDNTEHRWSAEIFAKNITDTRYYDSKVIDSSTIGSPLAGILAAPRTFGVELRKTW